MRYPRLMFSLALVFLLVFQVRDVKGQRFGGGVKMGLTASEVSGDNLGGPDKLGWFAAVYTNRQLSSVSSLQLELMFIQKGSRSTPSEKNNFFDYRFSLQYAEIPVLLITDFPWGGGGVFADRLSLETGLSAAFLVGWDEVENDRVLNLSVEKPFQREELNLLLGLYYPITSQILFHLRFSQGITPLRPHEGGTAVWYNRGQYNTVWTFGLSWDLL